MMDLFMVNWSGQPIPDQEMMVMRRVAIMMRTVYGATKVGFSHEICAGQVKYVKSGVYGAVGGHFFFGDLGAKNDMPNTVDFFYSSFVTAAARASRSNHASGVATSGRWNYRVRLSRRCRPKRRSGARKTQDCT
jgi:hypothetical protein